MGETLGLCMAGDWNPASVAPTAAILNAAAPPLRCGLSSARVDVSAPVSTLPFILRVTLEFADGHCPYGLVTSLLRQRE